MSRKKIVIKKKVLRDFYCNKNLSARKIGKIFGCSWSTIINRIAEFNIPLKSPSGARMKYQKKDFNNNLVDKAYMIGFRIGDLNVYKTKENTETVIVRCHTTQKEQLDVIRSLFNKFGKITISKNKGHFHINCFLNNSFGFLLSKGKDFWQWVGKSPKLYFPFIAGYTDAEGNFILNQGRARFKIDSYDLEVLEAISKYLTENNILNKFRQIYKKGEAQSRNGIYHNDLWRLNINESKSIYKFINHIKPFLRHEKRIRDVELCLINIRNRKRNGTIK